MAYGDKTLLVRLHSRVAVVETYLNVNKAPESFCVAGGRVWP